MNHPVAFSTEQGGEPDWGTARRFERNALEEGKMDPSPAGGGRRNKKRGGRSGGGGEGRGGRPNGGGGGRQQQQQRGRKRKRGRGGGTPLSRASQDKLPPSAVKDDSSILGGRLSLVGDQPKERQRELDGPPDGFGLFCAYHLGVTAGDGYQKPSLDETARRYGISHDEVRALLSEHKLDPETMGQVKFDLEGAKLDVRLAPEGISRIEIARDQYAVYLETLES